MEMNQEAKGFQYSCIGTALSLKIQKHIYRLGQEDLQRSSFSLKRTSAIGAELAIRRASSTALRTELGRGLTGTEIGRGGSLGSHRGISVSTYREGVRREHKEGSVVCSKAEEMEEENKEAARKKNRKRKRANPRGRRRQQLDRQHHRRRATR